MTASFLPTLFLSHGAPTLALDPGATGVFWERLASELPRTKAVLCVSAHWMTEMPAVNAPQRNSTIHDFYGFPEPLYQMHYAAPGAGDLARRVVTLLQEAGIPCATDNARGLDHGAWVPLRIMYPAADIPVAQLSIAPMRDAAWHYRLGAALRALRGEGVLVLASGGAVHNLRAMAPPRSAAPEWAQQFDEWLARAVEEGRTADLLAWTERAPFARIAQPSPDHFLPLFVALGAAGEKPKGERIHQGFTLGSLSMAAFRFT